MGTYDYSSAQAIEYTYRSFLVNIQFCVYTQRRVNAVRPN